MTDLYTTLEEQGEPCTIAECPPGPFVREGVVGFKTEYCAMETVGPIDIPGHLVRWTVSNRPDVYVMASGEIYWGGTSNKDDRDALIVQPVTLSDHRDLKRALEGAIMALEDPNIDSQLCCSGHECGCRGSTNRDLVLHDLRTALNGEEAGG